MPKSPSCFREFARYCSLNILGMAALSCYVLADTFFVANGLGPDGLAALNLAIPIYSFIQGCGLMLGGAVGNLVDRLLYGYVIDLFELTFVRFYIFNGADVAIVTGAVLCAVSALWFEKQNWKSGKEK